VKRLLKITRAIDVRAIDVKEVGEEIQIMPALPPVRLARTLAIKAIVAALAVPALLPGRAYADNPTPPSVPAAIEAPAGNVPYLLGHATGTQNYTCQHGSTGFAWTFVAPSATLVDDKGKEIMTHYAGPTWQAKDGSTVKGARVASVTVSTSAIDWLLLRATSTTPGQLGGTTYIQRVNTTGGLAPTSGCNGGNIGAALNVPYTADYYFYRSK
jgi:uncharacterized protein DUF3455